MAPADIRQRNGQFAQRKEPFGANQCGLHVSYFESHGIGLPKQWDCALLESLARKCCSDGIRDRRKCCSGGQPGGQRARAQRSSPTQPTLLRRGCRRRAESYGPRRSKNLPPIPSLSAVCQDDKVNCHAGHTGCAEYNIIDEPPNSTDRKAYFVQEVAPLTVSIVEQQEVKHGQNHCRFRNTMLGPDGMTCTRCNWTFGTKSSAQGHEICPSKHYRCACCGSGFTTLRKFLDHCKTAHHIRTRAGWTVYPHGQDVEHAEEEVGYVEEVVGYEDYGGPAAGYHNTGGQGGDGGPEQKGEEEDAQEV
ncbi:hypothetical protein DFJ74DRAFT_333691 [Hyaloraphidium curvatum]|nr:hypothetical protein DFJ74DRAFT_333691 [Hyaloraphidium curvatum]